MSVGLARLGRCGALLPVYAMGLGLAVPATAALSLHGLGTWVAGAIFFSLLAMEPGRFDRALVRDVALRLPAVFVLSPALAWLGCAAAGIDGELVAWIAIVAAAPVSSVAVAGLSVLGLPARPAAFAMLATVLLAPLTLPAVAWTLGMPGIDPLALAQRLLVLAALPAALALALRRSSAVQARRSNWRDAAVLALALQALARMHDLRDMALAQPGLALWYGALAFAATGIGMLALCLVVFPGGMRAGVLVGGSRMGSLSWAACSPYLPPAGHLFMGLVALPIYAIPMLARLLPGERAARPTELVRRPAVRRLSRRRVGCPCVPVEPATPVLAAA